MDRIDEILSNDKFNTYMKELKDLEKDRIFCVHDIEHSLDVARISYIKVLERNIECSKEVIYAAALLHDLGRVLEYKENIPHNIAGVKIAEEILKDIDFSNDEKIQIINAILKHRRSSNDSDYYSFQDCSDKEKDLIKELTEIINSSDKESRCCFNCASKDKCYWDEQKKNYTIKY